MNQIINILKEKKSIPLDQFINIALYDKKFGYYSQNILEIFKIWQGGMSFHGGLLGIIIVFLKQKNLLK